MKFDAERLKKRIRRILPAVRRALPRYDIGSAMILDDEPRYVVLPIARGTEVVMQIEFRHLIQQDEICHLIGAAIALGEHHR